MAHLFDTNTFLRLAEKNSPQRQIVFNAIIKLRSDSDTIYYTPQVMSELIQGIFKMPSRCPVTGA